LICVSSLSSRRDEGGRPRLRARLTACSPAARYLCPNASDKAKDLIDDSRPPSEISAKLLLEMSAGATVRLLEADPDIGRFLSAEEHEQARQLSVPVQVIPRGALNSDRLLSEADAFAAIVLDGVVLVQTQLGEHAVARLLGPGDFLSRSGTATSPMIAYSGCRVTTQTRVALLGNAVLLAARHWPRIVAGLHVRMADECERVATQLAICQLPRVEERLLAILWLLAESWGRVTAAGTSLPLALTHDVLGALVGARRPTVTLALGQLANRGAIVQQQEGWLLLESPPRPAEHAAEVLDASLIERPGSRWADDRVEARDPRVDWLELTETVARLREQHAQQVALLREQRRRLERSRRVHERSVKRITDGPRRQPRSPS